MSNGLDRFRSPSTSGHYYRGGYQYVRRLTREQIWQANLRRWKRAGRLNTVGDAAKAATTVAHTVRLSFRLVDCHGRAYGRRYTGTDRMRSSRFSYERLVLDRHGREVWLDCNARCRIVDAQPEDFHSRISRMLKAAHKRGEA